MRDREGLRAMSEHVLYEVQMVFQLANRLRDHVDDTATLPWDVRNACIESFALHTRVLFEFLWYDRKAKQPKDAFASDFFAPGEWEQLRARVQRSELDGLWNRASSEIAHLSYKRLSQPTARREWRFDLIAGVIGNAFRLFLENVSPEVVSEKFEPWMRGAWPDYLNWPSAIGYPSTTNPRSVATQSLQNLADVRVATFEDLLTWPDEG